MVRSHIILAISWIVYCSFHSVLASLWFKQMAERWMGRHYKFYRFYYTLFAFAGFVAIMTCLFIIPSYKLFATSTATIITGALITTFGGIIMIICIRKYFMQLSGLRSLIENRSNNQLMITGIHKHVRHPLYSGTFVFIWGLLILYPYLSLLIVDIIITVYTLIGLRFEEKKLLKEFEEAYKEYQEKVPMIIPRL